MRLSFRTLPFLLIPCLAWADNQIEFNLGHGSPETSLRATGSSDRAGSRGSQWSMDILHEVSPQIYFGLGGGLSRSADNLSETFVTSAHSTMASRTSSIFILSRTDLAPPSRLLPYAIVGIGWVKNSFVVTATPYTTWPDTGTSEQRTILDDSKSTLGYTTGVGLDAAITSRLFIGIEARYQGSLKNTFDMTSAGQAATGLPTLQAPLSVFMLGVKAGIKY